MPSPNKPQSFNEAVKAVKDWLSTRWIQKKWIETPHGAYAGDCKACLHGAAVYIGGKFGPEIGNKLTSAGFDIGWNDGESRTITEVEAALDSILEEKA